MVSDIYKKRDLLESYLSRYVRVKDPLGTPIFPIPIDKVFEINNVLFIVQASTIQGAGLGLFVHTSLSAGVTILHYGGHKYAFNVWKELCKQYPMASKYSLLEDPKVDCKEDFVYILGSIGVGNVAGYINSCHGTSRSPNVCYTLVPYLPPWHTKKQEYANPAESGYIIVETLCDILPGEELFASYEF